MSGERFAGYEPHDACDLFPLVGEAELGELADEIREHELAEPVA